MAINRKDILVALLNLGLGLGALLLVCGTALAAEAAKTAKPPATKPAPSRTLASDDNGYRDCNLAHLSACKNSNQLFFGPSKDGKSPRKTDFESALATFLRGTPYQRVAQYKFSPYDIARQSLVGPGKAPVHLSGSELFLDGFNTNYGPDRAAVIFDAAGHIVAVATLGSKTEETGAHLLRLSQRILTIYVRGTAHKAELITHMQDWARRLVAADVAAYQSAAKDVLAGTEIFAAADNVAPWKSEQK